MLALRHAASCACFLFHLYLGGCPSTLDSSLTSGSIVLNSCMLVAGLLLCRSRSVSRHCHSAGVRSSMSQYICHQVWCFFSTPGSAQQPGVLFPLCHSSLLLPFTCRATEVVVAGAMPVCDHGNMQHAGHRSIVCVMTCLQSIAWRLGTVQQFDRVLQLSCSGLMLGMPISLVARWVVLSALMVQGNRP